MKLDFQVALVVKNSPADAEDVRSLSFDVRSLGQEDPLEKEMAPHSNILAWKIPWMEDPSRLQSTGLKRVGHS